MRSIATSILFLLAAGLFLFFCSDRPVHAGAGDEPHYLIVADSFAHFDGVDIREAYLSGSLAKSLLPSGDLNHSREEVAAVQGTFGDFHGYGGPHGLYSVHNIGLPLLLVPVRWMGRGMLAAKLTLLLYSVLLPLLASRAAGLFLRAERHRLLAGAALCLATPFLIPATQLYPDLLAGILFAFVLLELCALRLGRAEPDTARAVLCGVALAIAPWLHLRLAIPTLLCTIGWMLLAKGSLARRACWCIVPVASLAGLAFYNYYAFDLVGGAYDKSAVEVSETALMVLFGLQFDQFQGIFVRAPLLLAALPGLALLARRDWPIALLYLLVYGTLVGPNAFHPNWYGGGSFGGRFVLAGAVTLIVPAALALSLLFEHRPRMAALFCSASLLMQAYSWYRFSLDELPIYNQTADRLLEDYAAPLDNQVWLPAFYRLDVAISHWPNLAWMVAALLLLAAGWIAGSERKKAAPFVYGALAAIIAGGAAGRVEKPIWEMVPRAELAAYAKKPPDGMLHVDYGDPREFAPAAYLVRQLGASGIQACVEMMARADLTTYISPVCGRDPGVPRLALVDAGGWHLVPLRRSPDEVMFSADFSHPQDARYLSQGWSEPEDWGVWSAAKTATLTLELPHPVIGAVRVDVEVQAFLPVIDRGLIVPIEVDGHPVGEWRFFETGSSKMVRRSLWIPAELVAGKARLAVTFRLDGAVSPKELGLSADTRQLGIGLRRAVLVAD